MRGGPRALAPVEVGLKRCHDTVGKRQPSGLEELGPADLDRPIVHVEIPEIQPHDLAETETGTVGQDQHHVQGVGS